MNEYRYLDDAPKEWLQTEVVRLHRQRVLMACIIRATQPRHDDDPRHLIADIIAELGNIADNITVEPLAQNAWYVEAPGDLTRNVTAAITDYLRDGGSW